jgi:hypothetical protein
MSLPLRFLLVSVLVFGLLAPLPTSAKGGFDFIAVAGPGLEEEIRITEEALTRDFFAFADFYEDRMDAPAEPGPGYQITRYYVQGVSSVPFDQLHYYPASGFVYYDGIAGGGSSEYDGGWYTAEPGIKAEFERALSSHNRPTLSSAGRVGASATPSRTQLLMLITVAASLAAVLLVFSWLRKPSIR